MRWKYEDGVVDSFRLCLLYPIYQKLFELSNNPFPPSPYLILALPLFN